MKPLFPSYSIGDFINKAGSNTCFEITRFEEMEEPQVEDPHKHQFYEILWVEEGESLQLIDDKSYTLGPHSLFFISPGQLHQFEAWQQLKGGTIMFTEEFFLQNQQNSDKLFELVFLDNLYFNPALQLQGEAYAEIEHTIGLLYAESRRKDYAEPVAQLLLQLLMAQISRYIESGGTAPAPKQQLVLYKKFKQLLDAHFKEGLGVSEYASRLHITQHHLNHICQQVTGTTAGKVIRARSMLEAKRMLSFSSLSVSEIAARLGFFDASYFAKVFRQETGLSAQEYRNQKALIPTD